MDSVRLVIDLLFFISLYDWVMTHDKELAFEKLISGETRVLVINPLNTYWSFFLTAEAAARAAEKSSNVTWINLACRQGRKFEINVDNNLPHWRYQDTSKNLKVVFDSLGIKSDTSYTKLSMLHQAPNFRTMQELRDFKSGNINVGAFIFSGIASAKKSTAFSLQEAKPYINHYFRYAFSSIVRLRKKILEVNPELILTTNDRLIGSSVALALATELGITSRVIYWGSTSNKIQDYVQSLYDSDEWQSQVMNLWLDNPPSSYEVDLLTEEINKLGSAPNEDSRKYLNFQKKGKTIEMSSKTAIFFAQSEHEHSPNFIVRDQRRFQTQYDAFLALQEVTKRFGWTLFLKYHPMRYNSDKRQQLANPSLDWDSIQKMDHVIEIPADSDIDTYRLIEDSALNIVWSSTVGLESIARQRPTLVLGNPHWLNRNWAIHAWSQNELQNFFSANFKPVTNNWLLPWFWFLSNFGSQTRYFRLVDTTFNFEGKSLVNERWVYSCAVRGARLIKKLVSASKD